MQLIAIHTHRLHPGDDLIAALQTARDIHRDDILVVSSKILATTDGNFADLTTIRISDRALKEAKITGRSPAFCQAVLHETARMNGRVAGRCPGALLCVVRPAPGIAIIAANAGMDESNVPGGTALGWPHDPVASAVRLHRAIGCPVVVIDSCCIAMRTGITAYALACSGIDPIRDERGKPDLFGKPLRITRDAIADELAAAASLLMGNAAQATPAVLVRDHGLPASNFAGWVPTFDPKEDLFRDVLSLAKK